MKAEEIKDIKDYIEFIKQGKTTFRDLNTAAERLVKIYGEKIIPGCALGEELNQDEFLARFLYGSAHDLLREDGNKKYNRWDNIYENIVRLQFKSKRSFSKIFWGVFIALIFFALLKYVFS